MPVKSLKFNKEKENMQNSVNVSYMQDSYYEDRNVSAIAKSLRNEKEVLAQELINLNRELTKLRVSRWVMER